MFTRGSGSAGIRRITERLGECLGHEQLTDLTGLGLNVVPELMVAIDRVCRKGEPGDVSGATAAMQEVGRILDQLTFPINIAAGLEARGFDPGAPKSVVSPESRALYEKIVAELRALFERHDLIPLR